MSSSTEFVFRTEDLRPEDVLEIFVSTARDRELVELLKSSSPLIVEGSRGTGKSLLLRVCEQEQLRDFASDQVLPVYVSFAKSSLLNTGDQYQFLHWMLARLSTRVLRAAYQQGIISRPSSSVRVLAGGEIASAGDTTALERVAERYELSYKGNVGQIDSSVIPSVEDFRDAVQDLCNETGIRRINVLFDEAAHIFRPEQQRQFFTLFRDLRSPFMTCNAAVYPGVTVYGDTFESAHDARIETLNRDISDSSYLEQMREIVFKQASSDLQRDIERNGENFSALAFAVSGNPRLLLKSVAQAGRLRSADVQPIIKDFFRNTLWSEHSSLAERYPGHKELIDWGKTFTEEIAIADAIAKNQAWTQEGKTERTCFFWVHRDAPAAAKEALRLLTYTGILVRIDNWAVATRSQIGTRYAINIGCLAAPARSPIAYITDLRAGLSVKRFTEYGANFGAFVEIADIVHDNVEADVSVGLNQLLGRSISVLDLTHYQKAALAVINIDTIASALGSSEAEFQRVRYIGPIRSRKMMNVVTSAVLEYLSG